MALLAAALFGISPVLAKLLTGSVAPALLAGLFYLGSGLALHAYLRSKGQRLWPQLVRLPRAQLIRLLGAVAAGGIGAPLLLLSSLRWATAFEVSLLLNLEAVATAWLAAFVFHEHVGARAWSGNLLIVAGAALLATGGLETTAVSWPALGVAAACVLWAIDNNLTRDIEQLPPAALAASKGWVAGPFNILFAVILGQARVGAGQAAASLAIGAVCYGASLVLFVHSLRKIGTARTSAYFATGPFVGMLVALLALGEHPPAGAWLAALLMAAGVVLLSTERHAHVHTHERLRHKHRHVHDEHHQHPHDGTEGPEPHDHEHVHEPIRHSHRHWPDIHHRHEHAD